MFRNLSAISIHAPRTGSDQEAREYAASVTISIHAPRTGSDASNVITPAAGDYCISIHAPRTGSDRRVPRRFRCAANFNPRSPHGERPDCPQPADSHGSHFNPRSPHGERLQATYPLFCYLLISIHAPRTGSDKCCVFGVASRGDFNPRSPHGERLNIASHTQEVIVISIHAPRTGSDVRF